MATRRITQVDALTGELLDGVLALQRPRQKNGFQHGGWIAMDQSKMHNLATNKRLTLEAHRVLAILMSETQFDNWLPINQAATARSMGMQPSHFNRALRILVEEGIVEKGPGPSALMRQTYRLNPEYGWKGSAKSHRAALNMHPAKTRLTLVEGS